MFAIRVWMAQCQLEAPGTKRKGIKAGRNPCRQSKPTLPKKQGRFFFNASPMQAGSLVQDGQFCRDGVLSAPTDDPITDHSKWQIRDQRLQVRALCVMHELLGGLWFEID